MRNPSVNSVVFVAAAAALTLGIGLLAAQRRAQRAHHARAEPASLPARPLRRSEPLPNGWEYQRKLISAAQENATALIGYIDRLMGARSLPELMDVSTSYTRRQGDMLAKQTGELVEAAEKLMPAASAGTAMPSQNGRHRPKG